MRSVSSISMEDICGVGVTKGDSLWEQNTNDSSQGVEIQTRLFRLSTELELLPDVNTQSRTVYI